MSAGTFRSLVTWALLPAVLLVAACDDDNGEELGTVEVVYNDQTVIVELADVEPVTYEGLEMARLSDLVELADLGVALDALELDFEAADGFRSSSSSNCVDYVPVPGAALEQGYLELATGDLYWEESLGFPGCLRVNETVRIIATDAD